MPKKRKKKFSVPKAVHEEASEVVAAEAVSSPTTGVEKTEIRKPGAPEITSRVALAVLAICGCLVFVWGLGNQFVLDDTLQITNNSLVHSVDLPAIFSKQTFETTKGLPSVAGIYYRPLMLLIYAVIYVLAGPVPWVFHAVQLVLYIGTSWLLFLVLCKFFRPGLSLGLALIFLVDPINSQNVYYIANLQEPLYFFFGMLAFWTYLEYQDKSRRYLIWTALFVFLSLLSKESGAMFLAIILIYAWITGRKCFWALVKYLIVPTAVYIALRVHALGIELSHHVAPIDSASLVVRLMNIPVIVWFYIQKIFWPWALVVYYYGVNKSPTVTNFLLPLGVDLVFAAVILWVYRYLKKRRLERDALVFWFFTTWLVIGLILNLQIIPLDMTTSDTWLMVPMVGLLGMIGILIETRIIRFSRRVAIAVTGVIVVAFGVRSAIRASDWRTETSIVNAEVADTNGDYVAESILANQDVNENEPAAAVVLAEQSIAIYPAYDNYAALAHAEFEEGDYTKANTDYLQSISYRPVQIVLDQFAELQMYYYNPNANLKNIQRAIYLFPKDGVLWTSYAMLNYKIGNIYVAQDAIMRAYQIHGTNSYAENAILHDQPVGVDIMGHEQLITPSPAALANPGGQEDHTTAPGQ